MVAKLAKTCTVRISPRQLNFILADKVASGGVSMWCELEQVSAHGGPPHPPPPVSAPSAHGTRSRVRPSSSLRRTSSANFKWKVSQQKTMRFI